MATTSDQKSLVILTEILTRDAKSGATLNLNYAAAISESTYAGTETEPQEDSDSSVVWKRSQVQGNAEAPEKEEIRADLIFEFIKTHMTESQMEDLQAQAQTLGKLLINAKATRQIGYSDELCQRIAQTLKEQEFRARGFAQWFDQKVVKQFMDRSNVRLTLSRLEKFPRPIPKAPSQLIQQLQEAKVFDELWILYMNPTSEEATSFSERIKRKDPILFGVSRYDMSRLFYVTDWVDEVCDLTMDKLLLETHKYDQDFQLNAMGPVEEGILTSALSVAGDRLDQLNRARPATYREDLAVAAIEEQGFSLRLAQKVLGALWRSRKAGRKSFMLMSSNGPTRG